MPHIVRCWCLQKTARQKPQQKPKSRKFGQAEIQLGVKDVYISQKARSHLILSWIAVRNYWMSIKWVLHTMYAMTGIPVLRFKLHTYAALLWKLIWISIRTINVKAPATRAEVGKLGGFVFLKTMYPHTTKLTIFLVPLSALTGWPHDCQL